MSSTRISRFLRRLRARQQPASTLPMQQLVQLPAGFAIVAYATRSLATQRYVGYAKAFLGETADYWDVTDCFAKFGSEGEHGCADRALEDVLQVALMSLVNIGFVHSGYASSAAALLEVAA